MSGWDIECVERVELPFMLNIPTGTYAVGDEGASYDFDIPQGLHAAYVGDGQFVIGTREAIRNSGGTYTYWQPLRTVVSHSTKLHIAETDLVPLSDVELHEQMQSVIIGEGPTRFANDTPGLKAEATKRLAEMDDATKTQFRINKSLCEQTRTLANADLFVLNLNRLIRLYMARFNDFFVEEVTLHQLASNLPLRGVFVYFSCNNETLHFFGHVGKVPPIMRTPWLNHPENQLQEFQRQLASGESPDAIDLLAVRSRNCIEKGAYRSAITEASAAMDLSLSNKLREGFTVKGKTGSEINDLLRTPKNQRFDERAKKLFNEATGKTVPALNNTLWEDVVGHRTAIRQGVTHSNAEPPKAEAEKVVNDFLQLAQVIRGVSVS